MAIAQVQKKTVGAAASANSATFDSPTTSGNLLICIASSYSGDGAAGCTDNKGNTFTEVTVSLANLTRVRIWYCANATGGAGHVITPTATASYRSIVILEYSGAHASAPLDGQAQNSGTTQAVSTGNIAVSQAGTLVLAAFSHEGSNGSLTETDGTVLYEIESAAVVQPASYIEQLAQSSAKNQQWTNYAAGIQWAANGASFKPAADPPAAPSGLSVTAVSPTGVDVTWTDNASNETGFTLQIDTVNTFDSGNLQSVDIPSADTTSTQAINLEPSTTYYFRIRAYNGDGPSGWSGTETTTTAALSTEGGRGRRAGRIRYISR